MDLQEIRTDRAAASVEYMGQTLNFKYRPAMITPNTYHKLTEAEDVGALSQFFSDLLVTWDLTKGGEQLEVTAEAVADLPMQLIRGLAQTIMQAVPQREVGNSSSDS
jgi:hypothetical protein